MTMTTTKSNNQPQDLDKGWGEDDDDDDINDNSPDTTVSHMKWGESGGFDQKDDGCGSAMVVAAGRMATTGGGRVAIVKRMIQQEAGQQRWR